MNNEHIIFDDIYHNIMWKEMIKRLQHLSWPMSKIKFTINPIIIIKKEIVHDKGLKELYNNCAACQYAKEIIGHNMKNWLCQYCPFEYIFKKENEAIFLCDRYPDGPYTILLNIAASMLFADTKTEFNQLKRRAIKIARTIKNMPLRQGVIRKSQLIQKENQNEDE